MLLLVPRQYGDTGGSFGEAAGRLRRQAWNGLRKEVAPDGTLDAERVETRRSQLQGTLKREEEDLAPLHGLLREAPEEYREEVVKQMNVAVYRRDRARYRLRLLDVMEGMVSPVEELGSFEFTTEERRGHAFTIIDAWNDNATLDRDSRMEELKVRAGETPVKKVQEEFREAGIEYEHRNPQSFIKAVRWAIRADMRR